MPGSYLEHALDYIERHLTEAPTTELCKQANAIVLEALEPFKA